MLDGIDQFIINSCIRKIPFEKIMTAIGYSEEKFNNRIEELRNKGINIYPGMEGKKLFGPDIQLYNLLEQNLGIEEIEENKRAYDENKPLHREEVEKMMN